MPHSHSATAKVSIGNAILADIDAGVGVSKLKLLDAGKTTTLASMDLPDPSGTVNGTTGVITFDCTPALEDTNTVAGTAAIGQLVDGDDNVIIDDISVGTSGTEIVLDNNVFDTGDTVQITALSYTPPS